MPAEDEVRAAARQFYAALNSVLNGDAGPMADVWSRGTDATTQYRGRDWGVALVTWGRLRDSLGETKRTRRQK